MSVIDVTHDGLQLRAVRTRYIIMDGSGDTAAAISKIDADGFIRLGLCELKEPVGAGNEISEKVDAGNVHTVLGFNNIKSIDGWINWLQDVKSLLIAETLEKAVDE